ncbi:hypothetical protein J4434_02230 [Candidatus Woesearchaeota archaeon]|nr:hypothetical protein [Candidatus Woesearchaeota archaeon]
MKNTNMENTNFYGFNQIFNQVCNNPLFNVNNFNCGSLNYGFDTSNKTIERLFFTQIRKLTFSSCKQ